jgi:hypothetical protein
MFRKIILWFLCKIEQPIVSPSLGDYKCLHCHKRHGVWVSSSPSHIMAENTICGEPLRIEKSPTKRPPDAGDSSQ